MATSLAADVLQDDLAVSLARAEELWRINYGPKDYGGRRGGDLIIDIDPTDASIKNVPWGQ